MVSQPRRMTRAVIEAMRMVLSTKEYSRGLPIRADKRERKEGLDG